jgi:arginyl-tRNA synthetase
MNLRDTLERKISDALCAASGETDCPALINYSKSLQFGDYQANGVMPLAKRLGRNPRELGEAVLQQLDLGELTEKVELAGPGFINIFIRKDYLNQALASLDKARLVPQSQQTQCIVIDYSSPNLAKEMHVGHLRGTIIGDAIARTFAWMGHKLIRQNHFGDWGTQFGMLITFMLELDDPQSELENLEIFYREAKQRFDEDPEFAQKSRENVVKLQSGDPQCLALWQEFIKVSIAHCQQLYSALNITLSEEDIVPESFYNDKLAGILDTLKQQELLKESEGAQCVFLKDFLNKDGDPLPTIIQKSDGGYLYATTDLAAIQHRYQTLAADRILYVVDARQSLHFQQVFAVAKLAGLASESCSLEHLSYGTMMGKDGKPFKTRSGGIVKLIDLIEEGMERALKVVEKKNPSLSEEEKRIVAHTVGISAIKYADLSKNRNSDYVFDWDQMLSFEGNTAPYLLYAYARIRSIFKKAELDPDADYSIVLAAAEEIALALKLLQFADLINDLMAECYPNQLCLYLYELAGSFMSFYEACPVLKAEGPSKESRLGLCQLTSLTLKQGLNLLGIETLERM